jgi:hypothetical protein
MRFVIAFKSVSRYVIIAGLLIICLGCLSAAASGQSTEITAPTPVRGNDVLGAIASRDIGDARLTDHFYAFTGTPGDLLITIEGINLNGDVDVITASGLRPLLKFSLYAGSMSPVTKSLYLRRREDLILRVEARSPNDDEGSYRIRFGGSFEPIAGSLLAEGETTPNELPTPSTTFGRNKGSRVSSVGARIKEPEPITPEISAAPAVEPTPDEEAGSPPATAAEEPPVTRAPARTPRGRRLPGRRTRTPPPAPAEDPATTSETETKAPADVAESEPAPRGRRRGATGRRVSEPTQEPAPENGPRLIIETSDGTLIDRDMATVRRVIVENGMVVVVGKDGKIQRVALASVTKMSISP